MGHGGSRPGSGRKPGSRTKKTSDIAIAAAGAGITPLEYMLTVMRDAKAERQRRDTMAIAAAPFMHPRLASIEHSGETTVHTVTSEPLTDAQWQARHARDEPETAH